MTGETSHAFSPGTETVRRRAVLTAGMAGAAVMLAGTTRAAAQAPPSGTVTLEQTQGSFLANAGWGRGTLTFGGKAYRFRPHNLGVGGIGIAKLSAHGEVYGLHKVEDFAGLYGRLRAGAVVADRQLKGGLWLANAAGVQMHLVPNRRDLALNVGADGLLIQFNA